MSARRVALSPTAALYVCENRRSLQGCLLLSCYTQALSQFSQVFNVFLVVFQERLQGVRVAVVDVSPPELHRVSPIDATQASRDPETLFNSLEATVEALIPAVVHQVPVDEHRTERDAEFHLDEHEVKARAIVGVETSYTFQGAHHCVCIYAVSYELDKLKAGRHLAVDTKNSDAVSPWAQAGRLDIKIRVHVVSLG